MTSEATARVIIMLVCLGGEFEEDRITNDNYSHLNLQVHTIGDREARTTGLQDYGPTVVIFVEAATLVGTARTEGDRLWATVGAGGWTLAAAGSDSNTCTLMMGNFG